MINSRILFLIIFAISNGLNAQRNPNQINVSGTVLSYTYDDTKSIFKKEKQIEVEGSLAKAQLKIINSQGETINKTESDQGGNFNFALPLGGLYTIIYSKNGYGTSAFELDVRSVSDDFQSWGLVLQNLDLILNNYESDKAQDKGESFGRLVFDSVKERFVFNVTQFEQKKRLFKKEEDNTSVKLMKSSVDKNIPFNKLENRAVVLEEVPLIQNKKNREYLKSNPNIEISSTDTVNFIKTREILSKHKDLNFLSENFGQKDILEFENQITQARAELERDKLNAVTETDFLNIAARERLLASAELQLENARMFIDSQTKTIEAQKLFIYSLIGLSILLLALGILIFFGYRAKKKNLAIIAEKNGKISESIRYATRIQRSVLLSEDQIKTLIPNSFVLYKPLDEVSGDFYWFSKINSTLVMAAVDCTGHGVPGAFMSLIGNTLLNQIVNEKKILKPNEILKSLHQGIVQSLNQNLDEEAAQDGMDIAVCCYDESTKKLTFSGANNSIYVFKNNEIKVLKANILAVGGYVRKNKPLTFFEEEIDLSKGDRIYMYSDGFMDQFGGPEDEKYNITRFKDLLSSFVNVNMDSQEDLMANAFDNWKGTSPQIDDVLVIGVEF